MSSSILIFGCEPHIKTVTSGILQYDELCAGSLDTDYILRPHTGDSQSDNITFSIANKYFDADLILSLQSSHTSEEYRDIVSQAECCILTAPHDEVIDDSISTVSSHAVENGIDVRMFVAIKDKDNGETVERHRHERLMWSLDNGFEYLEIDVSNPVEGHQLREKEGLPRLMEALNSNMWRSMKKKTSGVAQVDKTVFRMPAVETPSEKPDDTRTEKEDCKPNRNHEASASAVESQEGCASAAAEKESGPDFMDIIQGTIPMNNEDKDDKMWNDFSNVISQARQMREQAVKGNISDEDRRAKAAELAMQFCAMMDFDDSSDDES
mmetsp:Transcript_11182/g.17026  ORF Transcript_11182/g.17026 Transcript_11182/m.17026 type:complete len:324 (+) Transcript_11182:34-1005(+)